MPYAAFPSRLAILCLAVVFMACGPVLAARPARAQERPDITDGQGEAATEQKAQAILARQGYVAVSDMRRRGGVWVADVTERNGRRWRAVIDAASGDVSGLRPLPPSHAVIGMQTSAP